MIGAADTFRAAAVEQLEEWARRSDSEFVRGAPDSDPGAVAFDAVALGRERGADVVIIDTAGRLHTQDDLMAELGKVRGSSASSSPEPRTRRCSRSTPRRARTACARPSCSPRPSP